jgi:hypothetical protein
LEDGFGATPASRTPDLCVFAALVDAFACPPARIKRREFAVTHWREPRTPLSVALEKAHQLWGVEPCGGRYRVELTTLPPEVRGHASWLEPVTSLGPYTTPSSAWTDCAIQLSATGWTEEAVASGWPEICSVVLHEWGHLTGHSHSDDPGEPPEPPGMTREQLEVIRSASQGGEAEHPSEGLRLPS